MEATLDRKGISQAWVHSAEKVDKIKIVLIDSELNDFVSLKKVFLNCGTILPEWIYFSRLYEATQWLRLHKADVILVDVWLPDGFGRDIITTLQAIAPETPVIVLSDREDQKIALNLLSDGAQGCLPKKLDDPQCVVETIYRTIKRQKWLF